MDRIVDDVEAGRRLLAEAFLAARRALVFTGAGLSTESGIPDFRSPGGIWTRMRPIEFSEFLSSEEARLEDWRRRFEMNALFRKAEPNVAHIAIARLVAAGHVAGVVTQNIDGLHARAGVPPERLVEVHGTCTYATCLSCERRYELDAIEAGIAATGQSPRCESCGELVKAAIISFGQPMPEEAMRRAEAFAREADLVVAAGSSLVVWPAAGLPLLAQRFGAQFLVVNRDETALDGDADLVLRGPLGALFTAFFGTSVASLPQCGG